MDHPGHEQEAGEDTVDAQVPVATFRQVGRDRREEDGEDERYDPTRGPLSLSLSCSHLVYYVHVWAVLIVLLLARLATVATINVLLDYNRCHIMQSIAYIDPMQLYIIIFGSP